MKSSVKAKHSCGNPNDVTVSPRCPPTPPPPARRWVAPQQVAPDLFSLTLHWRGYKSDYLRFCADYKGI